MVMSFSMFPSYTMIKPRLNGLVPAFCDSSIHSIASQRQKQNFRCLSLSPSQSQSSFALKEGRETMLRKVLGSMESVYLSRNPTAISVLDIVRSADGSCPISYDHFAFRTFGVNEHGIDSMAKLFLDYGYKLRDELRFRKKKLRAVWLSPPEDEYDHFYGDGVNGPLPRIFISELLVHEMSPQTQEIIAKYVTTSGNGCEYAALASALGTLTWKKPLHSDYKQLTRESEYAAWTLVNGYALNHVTISTHRLQSKLRSIKNLNQLVESKGLKLNSEGGVLKVSSDGLLLQSSTVADTMEYQFSDGVVDSVACSYVEFAERLVLPQYGHLLPDETKEVHRRDGFEVGNADKIFESTYLGQMAQRTS